MTRLLYLEPRHFIVISISTEIRIAVNIIILEAINSLSFFNLKHFFQKPAQHRFTKWYTKTSEMSNDLPPYILFSCFVQQTLRLSKLAESISKTNSPMLYFSFLNLFSVWPHIYFLKYIEFIFFPSSSCFFGGISQQEQHLAAAFQSHVHLSYWWPVNGSEDPVVVVLVRGSMYLETVPMGNFSDMTHRIDAPKVEG